MIQITKWAGRHPILVRFVLLPILFYWHGRMAFVLGADLFFDGIQLTEPWIWSMVGVICLATALFPAKPRETLWLNYWRVKGLEFVVCLAGFGLWVYIGNQTAIQFEGSGQDASQETRQSSQTVPVRTAGGLLLADSGPATGQGFLILSKRAIRTYYKNAIRQIKQAHGKQTKDGMPKGLAIGLGVIGIALGIVVLICGIACGGAGGVVALSVIGGLGLLALGIWGLVYGARKTTTPTSP
ncbi:MAG: hypothetical protein LH606_13955 [Cytophagaceae bacterium]|nr:hypothetical protein [Cytophagaceae bacterium]